ncbi:hypothetical protein PR202_ga12113 [Eleusine coracana subsp. coracana]|uniref:Protein kinase domain-containing protein n=1 Tax=Eleusine coracana subsp. coracana TaxID=191504 RepID=A0AAV5CAS4_ELECO|nr:hypothetical protein PR202_ga12113 [Eleusine coracana subsp. coracana]
MVPKLADFGLSQIFSEKQTRITQNCTGTVGYMPPEYIEKGVISKMFDIYSMGVVMIKTISGLSGRSKSAEMPAQEFINLVRDSNTSLYKNQSEIYLDREFYTLIFVGT